MLNINGTLMRICHPASWRGSGLFFSSNPGLTPWAMEGVALTGSKFLGLSARQIPIYRAEVGLLPKCLLVFLFLTKSLGHACGKKQFSYFFTCQNRVPCVYFARPHQRILQNGVLAQLVERLNGIEKVSGSNPLCST